MNVTLLQVILIVSGIVILFTALDISNRQKFNTLHLLVFLCIGGGLLVFTIFPNILDKLWHFFGLQRGADVLVYSSILFLFYFVLLLYKKTEKNREDVTKAIREMAIMHEELQDKRR